MTLVFALASVRAVAIAIIVALSAFGQVQSGRYSVIGMVRNTVNGEPVSNALVVLERELDSGQPDGSHTEELTIPHTKATISGPEGLFHFDGLAAGNYNCVARKPDFDLWGQNSQDPATFVIPRPAADGPLQLDLTPLGAIEGKLVNQYDEALQNVVVVVFSDAIRDGERFTVPIDKTWTDNRGIFLLTRVQPGKYYVKAVGRAGGAETHVGPDEIHDAPWESFAPAYFGGAPDIGSATPIEVAPGAVVRANFRLEGQTAFKIVGKLGRYHAPEDATFELLRGEEPAEPHRAVLDGATGQFQILDVLPGTYKLRATQGKTRGEVSATVAGADLSGVSILLAPPLTVTVSAHPVGAPEGPADDGRGCTAILFEHRRMGSHFGATARDGGQASIEDVFPGEYRLVVQCNGAYLLSAVFGDNDLLANPNITVTSGAPRHIEIQYKRGGGLLNAKFVNHAPLRGAVLVVPLFSVSAGPVLHDVLSVYGALQPGTVAFTNLAPGYYSVYGLSEGREAEFRDPAFLRSLSGGTTVHIEDGKTAEVTIVSLSK